MYKKSPCTCLFFKKPHNIMKQIKMQFWLYSGIQTIIIYNAINSTLSQYKYSFFKQLQNFIRTCKTSYRWEIIFSGKVAVRAKAEPHKLFKKPELQHSLPLSVSNRPSSNSVGNCFFPQITLIILLLWIKSHFLLYIHICH